MALSDPKKFIEVGKVYNYPKAGCIVKRIHIVAEIEEQIVYRRWSVSKKYWWYSIDSRWGLDYFAEKGMITIIKKRRKSDGLRNLLQSSDIN